MKKNIIIWLSFCLFLTACGPKKDEDPKAELKKLKTEQKELNNRIAELEGKSEKKDSIIRTPVVAPSLYPSIFQNFVELQGRVHADNIVNASPEAPGVVQRIFIKKGNYVKKGQELAVLKAETLDRGIDELNHQIEFARIMYEKQKRLWAQDIGTEVQLLTAKNNYEALLKKRKTTVSQKSLYKITAPISGIVDNIGLKVGTMASPGMPGLITIVNTTDLKVKVKIPESYAGKVRRGKTSVISFPDLGDTLRSRISYMQQTIDPISRTFDAEIPVPSNGRIQPNMAATVKIITYENGRAFVFPAGLIQRINGASYVFVVDNENKAKLRRIETGNTYNGKVEIINGLNLDDRVVTEGYGDLNEGDYLSF